MLFLSKTLVAFEEIKKLKFGKPENKKRSKIKKKRQKRVFIDKQNKIM